ncbi:MEDS domain-containing protein [Archangium sp.]|uniref:MEDS domain-containing protein n=1 Tax=Archangium sp. TaxID=1872627 RepID=UPI00286CE15A|nr:MEDS domain-containing protein [Archangium sp.]
MASPTLLHDAAVAVGGAPQQLTRVGVGDHLCLLYERLEEHVAAMVPYLRQGLERGERCIYAVDEHDVDEVARILEAHGVDVEGERARKALVFVTQREVALREGDFSPVRMVGLIQELEHEALLEGFTGLRTTGEMTWTLGSEPGCEKLLRYESLLNRYLPGSHALTVCQYHRSRFRPELIRDVLRTHPLALIGDEVLENLFYESPELLLGEESAARRVEWMLSQLRRVRSSERTLVALGTRLAKQAEENERLYEEAREAVRTRDDFLSVASHELKTPLTPLHLRLQTLKREAETAAGQVPRERVSQLVEGAEHQLRKLTGLVDDLLDVSRLAAGKLLLRWEDVDLAEVAREVVAGFAQQSEKVGSRVEVEAEVPVMGRWDRLRLEQVVTNLLSNALKYGAGRPVHVKVEGQRERAVLEVRDEGIGIEPEHQARIFGKFERAVSGRHYGGLGLGLFIARQMVEAMEGQIQVESEPGRGSTFRVELLRRPEHAA